MQIGLILHFSPKKTEPFGDLLRRMLDAAPEAALGFVLRESPAPGGAEPVARVLKRFPEMAAFVREAPASMVIPGSANRPALTNMVAPSAIGADGPARETLLAIADGIPRSFPFHSASFQFHASEFGPTVPIPGPIQQLATGAMIQDSWWVSGRERAAMVTAVVEADPAAKGLPPLPPAVDRVVQALGKPSSTQQFVVPEAVPPQGATSGHAAVDPALAAFVNEFRADYERFLAALPFPNDLSGADPVRPRLLGVPIGPMKPVLVNAFKPMGYDCRSEPGTYTLRRRTASNLVIELFMDVGTWSKSYTGFYHIHGPAFRVTLGLPPGPFTGRPSQVPIEGPDGWRQIVENLAVAVEALDATLLPRVEALGGPAPPWFEPAS